MGVVLAAVESIETTRIAMRKMRKRWTGKA
jgi:hypothetical protein